MRERQPGTLSVWQVVELARHAERPYALDYIRRMAPDFVEYHGDRLGADDQALVGGVGTWNGRTTMFLGQQKGRNFPERVRRNFGMMHPEGYRKAMRLARQAAKFGFPIICLVDTPGAYPGAGAEERGIAAAIAAAIMEWFWIPVPVITAIIGEGGSGRCARAGGGGPGPDAGELDLLGRHARGGGVDRVARQLTQGGGRRAIADHLP